MSVVHCDMGYHSLYKSFYGTMWQLPQQDPVLGLLEEFYLIFPMEGYWNSVFTATGVALGFIFSFKGGPSMRSSIWGLQVLNVLEL